MSTLFDSYTDPNIPGIFTSVVDNSIVEDTTESLRSVFMVMPLKYGSSDVMVFSKSSDLKAAVGSENSFKYGLGQFYARTFIDAGATVYIKRLEDTTSTYANQILRRNYDYYGTKNTGTSSPSYSGITGVTANTALDAFTGKTITGCISKDTLIQISTSDTAAIKENKLETVFSLLAKGRGSGYNDLYATYSNATEYEKQDSTDEGIVNYKFNFFSMDVYENNTISNEVVKKSKQMICSLMDIDPVTKNTISHKSNGDILWVNSIVENSNLYLTAKINPTFQEEIRQYPNLDAVLDKKGKPFLFVEGKASSIANSATDANGNLIIDEYDTSTRVWYEVSINDSTSPVSYRIKRATFTPYRQLTDQPIFALNVSGSTVYKKLVVVDNNGSLSLDFKTFVPASASFVPTYGIGEVAYIDGDNAFYTLKATYDSTNLTYGLIYEPFRFLRWELYTFLMKWNMKLAGGQDSTTTSGFINTDGSINIDNVANATYKYIRDDKEIREVIYPLFTFNYVIDWTGNVQVRNIMSVLSARLKRTMNITSCPSVTKTSTGLSQAYDAANDEYCRSSYLITDNYNTMIYSSQHNKTHFDSETKQTYKLPACYYALLDHLYVDQNISITEPVANIEKGILRTTNLKLSHTLYSDEIETLRKLQINCIVTDANDNYFIDQLTAYKKTSKLSLGNVVKTLQYIQTILPKRLKKYLQKKETDVAITTNVLNEIQTILKPYKTSTNGQDSIFKEIVINPSFANNILTVSIRLTPSGTTEKINIPIIVQS